MFGNVFRIFIFSYLLIYSVCTLFSWCDMNGCPLLLLFYLKKKAGPYRQNVLNENSNCLKMSARVATAPFRTPVPRTPIYMIMGCWPPSPPGGMVWSRVR